MLREPPVPQALPQAPPAPPEIIRIDDEDNGAPPPQQPASTACTACMNVPLLSESILASCGRVYCFECLVRLAKSTVDAVLPCKHPDGTRHTLDLDGEKEAAAFLSRHGVYGKIAGAKRKHEYDDFHKRCPQCGHEVLAPNFAKTFYCDRPNCVNPSFGYCVTCTRSIESPHPPHSCVDLEAERTFKEYIARNGVAPCPNCGTAAFKEDPTKCNHMTCRCDTGYCGACGHAFPKELLGRPGYFAHTCVVVGIHTIAEDHIWNLYDAASAAGPSRAAGR